MLGSIFTLIGILAIGIAILLKFILPTVLKQEKSISSKHTALLIGIGLIFIFLNGLFFYAEPGMSYLVQYPWGKQTAVLTPGYKLKIYGNVLPFKKVLTVRFNSKDRGGEQPTTGMEPHIKVRFNDAVTADVGEAIRFRLPMDSEQFIKMAVDFRSIGNLVTSSLKPVCKEVTRNAARMLAAQEYIAGKGGEFEVAIQDQMENGIYILETIEDRDTTADKMVKDDQREIEAKETVKYKVQVKKDANGNFQRKMSPFTQYGITVAQSAIEYIEFEAKFKEMLGQQRDAAAEANVERQRAKKAEFEKQRIIAEGEKNKASVRAQKEQEQVEALITAETKKKKAMIELEEEELILQKNRKAAQSIKVLADAEAHKKRAMMKADNALEIRINAMKEIHKNYADMLGKHNKIVPDVVIQGDDKGGKSGAATDLVQLLTAQTAKQLGLDANNYKSRN